ncbi:hypothetical protein GOODEAATRI_010842 [Goodea atripinnis]|uniref:Uncharacterized protein n=1 Tax=Goodea atripinnis TaxID=208336 RepID=A0ABV0PX07_9TELE
MARNKGINKDMYVNDRDDKSDFCSYWENSCCFILLMCFLEFRSKSRTTSRFLASGLQQKPKERSVCMTGSLWAPGSKTITSDLSSFNKMFQDIEAFMSERQVMGSMIVEVRGI